MINTYIEALVYGEGTQSVPALHKWALKLCMRLPKGRKTKSHNSPGASAAQFSELNCSKRQNSPRSNRLVFQSLIAQKGTITQKAKVTQLEELNNPKRQNDPEAK